MEATPSPEETNKLAHSTKTVGPSTVTTLNAETFDGHVTANPHTLVKFYAPWCGYCTNLAPTWQKLAAAYDDCEGVSVAHVDCTQADSESVCEKYGVRGYPTVKYFSNGDLSDGEKYKGDRDMASLSGFLAGKAGINPR